MDDVKDWDIICCYTSMTRSWDLMQGLVVQWVEVRSVEGALCPFPSRGQMSSITMTASHCSASKGQSQHLATILHRFSSQRNRTSKYQKKNRRDHGLGKMKGFYVLMPKHINNFYSQNSFYEDTEEKDSLELLPGSIKMKPYKNTWAFVLRYKK